MKSRNLKRLISVFTMIIICSLLFVQSVSAVSTTAFSKLSSTVYAKTFTLSATGTTIPYTNKNLNVRGSVTYGASSTAYIDNKSDEIYVYKVGCTDTKYWAYVSYPCGSKRAYAYIYLSAITSSNGSHALKTSTGKFYCSLRSNTSNSTSYYVNKGDSVYLIAKSGSKYQILYNTSNKNIYRLAWCNESDYIKYCGVAVTGVTLSKSSLTLTSKGATSTLTATVAPSNATDKTITWTSSNTSIATVSSSGKVTAVANGTATITAKSNNGKTATCKVTVKIPTVAVTGVSLSKTSLTLTSKGATATLTATVAPSNATNKTITWTSSNTSIATVSSSGKVTAVANGTATITAKSNNGKTATCKVTVKIPTVAVTGVSLSKTSLTLTSKGATATLTATVAPSNATNKTITWTSSNKSVATVSSSGKVTAVANGTATITAKSNNGKTATCKVTVKIPTTYTGYVNTNSAPLALRESPSTSSKQYASMPKGSSLTVLDNKAKTNGFYRVTYNGITGYASAEYITFTKPTTTVSTGTYSINGDLLTVNGVSMNEYRIGSTFENDYYANVNGQRIYTGAKQCYGYACYIEHKFYGHCWHTASSRFPNLAGSENIKPNARQLKNLIQSAGVGAHLRTQSGHSMILIGFTDSGFTVADANADGKNTVDVRTYTWNSYLNTSFGQSGFEFIEIHK